MSASLPREVLVAGGDVGRFGLQLAASLSDLTTPVIGAALSDAGVDRCDIQAAFVGNAFGGMIAGQETILGQILLNAAAISSVPIHTIKNACSSGADAVHLAWAAVAFGQYDCVLAVGAEKMTSEDRGAAIRALATASDRAPTSSDRSVFMDLNAERADAYMAAYGATPRHFAMCAVKNRDHAARNENAAVRDPVTVEQVLSDRVVAGSLTRLMCGGIADGAAAVVLMSAAFARQRGLRGPRLMASCVVSGDPAAPADQTVTFRAGRAAFEAAGVDPSEVSLAEVHDPTSPQEFLDIEALGLCGMGGSVPLIEAGETSLGGRLPVNVSGGLTSRGHPVGATGVAQIVEISRQLEGRAGRSQVEGARIGVAQMAGGLLGADSAIGVVHLLGKD